MFVEKTLKKRTFTEILSYIFFALTGAYALCITGFLLVRLVVGEEVTLVGVMNSLIHLLVIPAFFLLPVCLLARKWQLSALFVPSVIAFGVWNLPTLLPPNIPQTPPDAMQITVLSYNLKAAEEENSLSIMAEVIRRADADLVGLQELSEEAAAYFETEFEETYPHQRSSTFPEDPIGGHGILSRYPIEAYETFRAQYINQEAVIALDNQRFSLYNVHVTMPLVSSFALRNKDVEDIINRTLQSDYPVILLGDFNITDRADSYQAIREHYRDAFYESGQGLGWTHLTASIPLSRLDYIFYDEFFTALETKVLSESGGSDHLPVRTVFALTQP